METTRYQFSLADYYNNNNNNNENNICQGIYNLVNDFLDTTLEQINSNLLVGGKHNIKRRRQTHNSRNKKRKLKLKRRQTNKIKHQQKGGMAKYIVLFVISILLLAMQVNGIKNVTKQEVVKRLISTSGEVSKIFENNVGTCALNSLLWLKVIDLPTFETKSIEMITGKAGLTGAQLGNIMNKQISLGIDWTKLTLEKPIIESNMTDREMSVEYINMLKNRMIQLRRQRYGSNTGYHILNPMSYPSSKDKSVSHAVVIWLMPSDESDELDDNDIAIIDPQTFVGKRKPIIYSSGISSVDTNVAKHALSGYIIDNIDFKNYNRYASMFESFHTEVSDANGDNRFTIDNDKLFDTINTIQKTLRLTNKVDL